MRQAKSKLGDPLPRRSGSDYRSGTAIQCMFEFIKGAYRRREIWLVSNDVRCHMAKILENREYYAVKMKKNIDVIAVWRRVKTARDIARSGWRMLISNVQETKPCSRSNSGNHSWLNQTIYGTKIYMKNCVRRDYRTHKNGHRTYAAGSGL